MKEVKQPNGIRLSACPTKNTPRQFAEHFQALNLDGENSLHRSNSSSSSSLNQTPPETPATTPHPALSQCPSKPRVNGIPTFVSAPGLPLCDTTSPPPPPTPTFNNCSVPYTTYQFTAIPTRSMFPYSQSYRPPFAPFPSYQTNENSFPSYSLPSYMPLLFSSPYPPRNPNCYNCGAMGHTGQDCTGQNIEDITQKKTYTIEFSAPPLPDADK